LQNIKLILINTIFETDESVSHFTFTSTDKPYAFRHNAAFYHV